jgi:hypothetical protein
MRDATPFQLRKPERFSKKLIGFFAYKSKKQSKVALFL